jgi:S-adenosylmethionine:tRNA ribosyltransferase-isomerase
MSPATEPRASGRKPRLLRVDAATRLIADLPAAALPDQLGGNDVVVVNDAATLPASLAGTTLHGDAIELRLAGRTARDLADVASERATSGSVSVLRFRAVLFGAGDWRTPTEHRPPPPRVAAGDLLHLGGRLRAFVEAVDPTAPRLLDVALYADGGAPREGDVAAPEPRAGSPTEDVWPLLYAQGRPIQYAHLAAPIHLWDVQNAYASRPWCFEMASAGGALDPDTLFELTRRGIRVTAVTHGAGLSSTGDADLDRRLPLDEVFEVPASTARAVARARREGGRVVAIGTSVVRALESARDGAGGVRAVRGSTSLRLSSAYRRSVVDAVLSGVHEPGTSHFELLCAFTDAALLTRANEHAETAGYLGHEFGDFTLVTGLPIQRLASALSA